MLEIFSSKRYFAYGLSGKMAFPGKGWHFWVVKLDCFTHSLDRFTLEVPFP